MIKIKMKTDLCIIDGCTKLQYVKKLCTTHYKRQWRHGDTSHCELQFYNGEVCSVSSCKSLAKRKGLCKLHYMRQFRYGRTHLIRNKNGLGSINKDGYRLVTINGVRVYEHIFVAELALKRTLPRGTIVHHVNSNRSDNTNSNLVICPSQAYHLLLHRRMKEMRKVKGKDLVKKDD